MRNTDAEDFFDRLGVATLQNVDGINYLYIKKGALYFVATTKVRITQAAAAT